MATHRMVYLLAYTAWNMVLVYFEGGVGLTGDRSPPAALPGWTDSMFTNYPGQSQPIGQCLAQVTTGEQAEPKPPKLNTFPSHLWRYGPVGAYSMFLKIISGP